MNKILSWASDYIHMVQGGALMTIHRNPPKHYLGHVVEGKAPVILIPGILGKWGFMKKLGDHISLDGHPVYIVPELNYNVSTVEISARKIWALLIHTIEMARYTEPDIKGGSATIRKAIERHGIDGVILVAHSKGGLIGKYVLAHHNHDERVKGLIAIATPFSGSSMAKIVPHDAFRELLPESETLKGLEEQTEINKKIVSIIPEYDNHVWAEKGSYLEGAKNIRVTCHGHHKVLFSKEVQDAVIQSIREME